MTDETRRPSLKDFDACADRNGQDLGQGSPLDIALPARTQGDLTRASGGAAQAARIASGTPASDATEATEAETPPETLRRLKGEASGAAGPDAAAAEAIERATSAVGQDDGTR